MTDLPYLVAGGGIAGLAAALGLARAGRPVRLFEQAAAFEEVGAGLQMSPNAVRALQALGAWDAVAPACVIPSEIHVRDGPGGALLQRIRLGKPFETRFGAPYRVCHRAGLLAGLVAAAIANPAISLHTGWRALAMANRNGSTTLDFAGGATEHGRAVIAADGIRSDLREAIVAGIVPQARGHALFRALIPFNLVPPGIEADCVTLWLCPGGHVVHYPVSNWQSFNIVAAIDSKNADGGWNAACDGREIRTAFGDMHEPLEDLIRAVMTWRTWQGADLPGLERWSTGRLVLVGDAAHASLPYLAQGAAMALEDAAVLSAQIAANADCAAAFRDFEALRRTRTVRIQEQSRQLGKFYHAGGARAVLRNAALRLLGAEAALSRNRWIYEWEPL